jgi:RHS repeat-associated protein
MVMPSRTYTPTNDYRYGFNGKEKDKNISSLTAYDYGFRIYSPAIGRFLSVDPLTKSYPWFTPYQFASNTPVQAIDVDGKEGETYLETKIENGKEIVLHRVIEVDVYVAITRNKNDEGKNYFVKDASKDEKFKKAFTNDLASHYKDGKFKDKDGNPIVFKFNVESFDVGQTSVDDFKKNLRDKEVGVLKDGEGNTIGIRGVVIQQTHINDVKPPVDAEATFPGGEAGDFSQPNGIKINDEQFDEEERSYTVAHEVGHFMLRLHPDPKIKNMGDSPERHDLAGKGIFHYYPVKFTFVTSQINPSQNNRLQVDKPGKENVNQANVDEILKSVVDTGKKDVTPKQ